MYSKSSSEKKERAVIEENVSLARTGYDYAAQNFRPFAWPLPMTDTQYAVLSGKRSHGDGRRSCGVKFYCAYPMSPSTGVLHWMAEHARKANIMVRQVEDEIGCHQYGNRSRACWCSFHVRHVRWWLRAHEARVSVSQPRRRFPVVVIDCQRAGPSDRRFQPKTEQGDLWQMLGAAFGDYPRVIAAPLDIADCFKLMPEIFNITDKFQCPGIVLCDLLLSEGRLSVDPAELNFHPLVDRGELTTSNGSGEHEPYQRYKITESGVSPRVIPGVPDHTHTVFER